MPNLANASDAQTWLDNAKVTISDGDDSLEQNAAEALVRGYLSNKIDSTTLAAWNISTPTSIPTVIRLIAGKLVAAFRIRRLVSESKISQGQLSYGQLLYNEAMALLNDVICGKLNLYDVSGTAIEDVDHIDQRYYGLNDAYQALIYPIQNPDGSQHGNYAFGMGDIF